MSEYLGYNYFVPNKRGRVLSSLFVGATVCTTLVAAYFIPKAVSKEEIGRDTVTLEYGESVEGAIASTCDKVTGVGVSDYIASVAASKMIGEDGEAQSIRFQHPTNGAKLLAVCVRYELPILNNNPF